MRILETKLFMFDELSGEAKEKARTWMRDCNAQDSFAIDEAMDSSKALFEVANIKLTNWEVGPYAYSSVTFDMGDAGKLSGPRAIAWLENNLLSKLRITQEAFNKNRKDYMGYGDGYRVGKVKSCPLTGVCYDEDLLESLRKSVASGDTLKDAFANLADVVRKVTEAECEYQNEDEQIDDTIRANEYEFMEDGARA